MRNSGALPFAEIDFGSAAAENESQDSPELLLAGYYDLNSYCDRILDGPEFLVLGYKGSGKSALGKHIELSSSPEKTSVRFLTLRQLPYQQFPKEARPLGDDGSAFPAIWSLHLLLQFIDMIRSNSVGRVKSRSPELTSLIDDLEAVQLLPAKQISEIIYNSVAKAKSVWGERSPYDIRSSLVTLVAKITETLVATKSSRRAILVLDGLDELLDPTPAQLRNRLNGER